MQDLTPVFGFGSTGLHLLMTPAHLPAVTDIQSHQEKIGGARQQFQNLDGVKRSVEFAGLSLYAEKDGCGNKNQ